MRTNGTKSSVLGHSVAQNGTKSPKSKLKRSVLSYFLFNPVQTRKYLVQCPKTERPKTERLKTKQCRNPNMNKFGFGTIFSARNPNKIVRFLDVLLS